MPKKGRKSIGQSTSKVRKFRGANEEATTPSETQASFSNQQLEAEPMETSTCDNEMKEVTNVRVYEQSSLVFDYSMASGSNNNPCPSAMSTSRPTTSTIQEEKSSMSKTIPSIKIKIILQIKQFI